MRIARSVAGLFLICFLLALVSEFGEAATILVDPIHGGVVQVDPDSRRGAEVAVDLDSIGPDLLFVASLELAVGPSLEARTGPGTTVRPGSAMMPGVGAVTRISPRR